jgi:hypothetical protein
MRHQTPSPAPPPFRSHHASPGYSMNAVSSDAAIGLSAVPRLHDLDVRADFLEQGLRHVGHAVHRAPEFHVLAIFALGQNPEGLEDAHADLRRLVGHDRRRRRQERRQLALESGRPLIDAQLWLYREVFAWAATMS